MARRSESPERVRSFRYFYLFVPLLLGRVCVREAVERQASRTFRIPEIKSDIGLRPGRGPTSPFDSL